MFFRPVRVSAAHTVIIEVHTPPGEARCDEDQPQTGDDIVKLHAQSKPIVRA